jgi:segregation and condensation protein B
MSSRKKKRDKRAQKRESADAAAATDLQPTEADAEGDTDEAEDAAEDVAEPAAGEEEAQAEAPAVSEISELKPRRKRKRAADEDAPVEEAAEVASEDAEVVEEEEDEEDFVDDTAKEAPKTRAQLKRVLESLIFVSDQIITAQQLGRIAKSKVADVREMLAELSVEYEGRGIELVEVNGGYQFRSAAASAAYVRVLVASKPVRLTRAQLETLALIAYRQPITRPEVDDVRGVDSGSAIKVLLDRDLIKILGRKEDAGRPLLYGTTPYFLEFFGMNSMQELPTLREFTELSDEHRELFQRKTNEIGDLSAEAEIPIAVAEAGFVEEADEPAGDSEPAAVSAEDDEAELSVDTDADDAASDADDSEPAEPSSEDVADLSDPAYWQSDEEEDEDDAGKGG